MYLLPSSFHSKNLRKDTLTIEFFIFITLCSTETDFDKACLRFDKALQKRGYRAHEVSNIRRTVKWENKKEILE